MSQPIGKPGDKYKHPLEGPLHSCPHCGKILNQHFAPECTTAVQSGADSISGNEIINLFGAEPQVVRQPEAPPLVEEPEPDVIREPDPTPAPPPSLINSGDIFVPSDEPQVIRRPEQVATGQHRPEKRDSHVIPGMQPREVEPPRPIQHAQADALNVLDHAVIGGRVTIVVCCYGEKHENLHRRCLNSIVKTVPPSRMDLRIISNQVGLASTNYFNSLPARKVYADHKQRRKYTGMRQVFGDKEDPIDTNYIVWFDDDSYARNEAWLSILAQTITAQKVQERVGMYGHLMYHVLKHPNPNKDPRQWFRNASWFRNKGFRDARGKESPNGNKIHFCVGGFWAISTECMRASDIPDARLNHNGGDVCIGEQIWQNGYKMKQFNESKQFIHTSAAPRRGFKEKFPWYR